MSRAREIARKVLATEAAAVEGLIEQLDESFDEAVALLAACRGRVVCTGMGKSGLVLRKVAATLASTGTPALFLHPAEAIHGDLGMLTSDDVVLAASYSGFTEELVRLAEILKRLGVPMVAITGSAQSAVGRLADIHLPAVVDREACPLELAPTASTTAALAMGDALAMALLETKGFSAADFKRLHPGGSLSRKLLTVAELMHSGDDLPRVTVDTPMPDALYEMSSKRLGITAVVDAEGGLVGCLTDGDLRRLLAGDPRLLERSTGECMHPDPYTIGPDELASAALKAMEDRRITSLFVRDPAGKLVGLVHLHDLWQLELF
ncbi:MAG: KpsF/GutQ family sugar-phosphate isomerase [Acidobacteriota bacterium]|nr:KpsF/GutQ family sugar-phosphate isomerase [Acidobacteriota bacterium]MDH3524733.1 KpsF/GutQ family sugar-phosphate isomerase [Acidobacteriota bacterium]